MGKTTMEKIRRAGQMLVEQSVELLIWIMEKPLSRIFVFGLSATVGWWVLVTFAAAIVATGPLVFNTIAVTTFLLMALQIYTSWCDHRDVFDDDDDDDDGEDDGMPSEEEVNAKVTDMAEWLKDFMEKKPEFTYGEIFWGYGHALWQYRVYARRGNQLCFVQLRTDGPRWYTVDPEVEHVELLASKLEYGYKTIVLPRATDPDGAIAKSRQDFPRDKAIHEVEKWAASCFKAMDELSEIKFYYEHTISMDDIQAVGCWPRRGDSLVDIYRKARRGEDELFFGSQDTDKTEGYPAGTGLKTFMIRRDSPFATFN